MVYMCGRYLEQARAAQKATGMVASLLERITKYSGVWCDMGIVTASVCAMRDVCD